MEQQARKQAQLNCPGEYPSLTVGACQKKVQPDIGQAYLITFTAYGTWMPGDDRGSIHRIGPRKEDTQLQSPNITVQVTAAAQMKSPAMLFDAPARAAVKEAIIGVCRHRGWRLAAINVRTNHVHSVVIADSTPERVMNDFKSYATRNLKAQGFVTAEQIVWTRHGSTRYLNSDNALEAAVFYVEQEQGCNLDFEEPAANDQRTNQQAPTVRQGYAPPDTAMEQQARKQAQLNCPGEYPSLTVGACRSSVMPGRKHPRGLSLVEVLMVIFIASILTALVVGAMGALTKSSAKQQAEGTMAALDAALDEYKTVTGEYPRIAGTFAATPTAAEVPWMTYALAQLKSTQNGPTFLAPVDQFTDTYDSTIAAAMPGFRNANINGANLASSVTAAVLESVRTTMTPQSLTFLRDPWDRYIVYVPSDPSNVEIASTKRPMFISAGADGRLESIPWQVNGAAIAYPLNGRIYYKQRWYNCTSAHTSSSALAPDVATSRWSEIVTDDITTRGEWR